MKKLFKVLLVVLLFLGVTGCKPVVNERLEAREVGDLLIEAYSEFFTVVERKAIPEELEHLVLDCIVLEGYYESGERTDGIVVIIEPEDNNKVMGYFKDLANANYENLILDVEESNTMGLYNNDLPIVVLINSEDVGGYKVISYEAIEMTLNEFMGMVD
jgi:hypothetical protein